MIRIPVESVKSCFLDLHLLGAEGHERLTRVEIQAEEGIYYIPQTCPKKSTCWLLRIVTWLKNAVFGGSKECEELVRCALDFYKHHEGECIGRSTDIAKLNWLKFDDSSLRAEIMNFAGKILKKEADQQSQVIIDQGRERADSLLKQAEVDAKSAWKNARVIEKQTNEDFEEREKEIQERERKIENEFQLIEQREGNLSRLELDLKMKEAGLSVKRDSFEETKRRNEANIELIRKQKREEANQMISEADKKIEKLWKEHTEKVQKDSEKQLKANQDQGNALTQQCKSECESKIKEANRQAEGICQDAKKIYRDAQNKCRQLEQDTRNQLLEDKNAANLKIQQLMQTAKDNELKVNDKITGSTSNLRLIDRGISAKKIELESLKKSCNQLETQFKEQQKEQQIALQATQQSLQAAKLELTQIRQAIDDSKKNTTIPFPNGQVIKADYTVLSKIPECQNHLASVPGSPGEYTWTWSGEKGPHQSLEAMELLIQIAKNLPNTHLARFLQENSIDKLLKLYYLVRYLKSDTLTDACIKNLGSENIEDIVSNNIFASPLFVEGTLGNQVTSENRKKDPLLEYLIKDAIEDIDSFSAACLAHPNELKKIHRDNMLEILFNVPDSSFNHQNLLQLICIWLGDLPENPDSTADSSPSAPEVEVEMVRIMRSIRGVDGEVAEESGDSMCNRFTSMQKAVQKRLQAIQVVEKKRELERQNQRVRRHEVEYA